MVGRSPPIVARRSGSRAADRTVGRRERVERVTRRSRRRPAAAAASLIRRTARGAWLRSGSWAVISRLRCRTAPDSLIWARKSAWSSAASSSSGCGKLRCARRSSVDLVAQVGRCGAGGDLDRAGQGVEPAGEPTDQQFLLGWGAQREVHGRGTRRATAAPSGPRSTRPSSRIRRTGRSRGAAVRRPDRAAPRRERPAAADAFGSHDPTARGRTLAGARPAAAGRR